MNENNQTTDNQQPEKQKSVFNLQKYFITGLIVILPLWFTFSILWLIFKWISNITKPFLEPMFILFFDKEPATFLLRISGFLLTISIVYLSGIFATNIISRKILLKLESLLIRIPLLRGIYSAATELTQFIFKKQKKYYRVVILEWPRKGIFTFGFVTSEIDEPSKKQLLGIFMPTTPNPTTGFFLIVPEQDTIPLDISVEDALKMIISGGIVTTDKIKNLIITKTSDEFNWI